MSKVVVFESLSLDGVMQAAGRRTRTLAMISNTVLGDALSRPDHAAGNGHGRCAAAGPTDLRGLRSVMVTYQPAA